MPLNASVGSSSANSYATVAEADAYFSTDYGSDFWVSLTNAIKEVLLITATRLADNYIDWNGYKYGDGSLRWPRARAPQVDSRIGGFADSTSDGDSGLIRYYTNSEIPTIVKSIVFELARFLYSGGGAYASEPNDIESVKIASISVTFATTIQTSGFPQRVKDLIPYVGAYSAVSSAGIKQVRVQR